MHVINVRNVHEALPEAIYQLRRFGVVRPSRNGEVLVAPFPVATCYQHPQERVLFWPERDANPFFHLMEGLWMLGGRRDVAFLKQFISTFDRFSDDGKSLHGAYGHRWRAAFGFDQLQLIIDRLKADKDDRRQVLQVWSAKLDLEEQEGKKDIPYNLTIHFQVSHYGFLDMTVFCRSNDIIWGAYGANAVHWSMLQEYVAAHLGVEVGRYWQISSNWHAYVKTLEPIYHLERAAKDPFTSRMMAHSPYEAREVAPLSMIQNPAVWDVDLKMFLEEGAACVGYREPFFRRVAVPLIAAHDAHKQGRPGAALELAGQCVATDWRKAAVEWLLRRKPADKEAA